VELFGNSPPYVKNCDVGKGKDRIEMMGRAMGESITSYLVPFGSSIVVVVLTIFIERVHGDERILSTSHPLCKKNDSFSYMPAGQIVAQGAKTPELAKVCYENRKRSTIYQSYLQKSHKTYQYIHPYHSREKKSKEQVHE
jgi:hypothetical protein